MIMLMTIYECKFFYIYILSLVISSLKLCKCYLILQTKIKCVKVLKCCKCMWFFVFIERCTPYALSICISLIKLMYIRNESTGPPIEL